MQESITFSYGPQLLSCPVHSSSLLNPDRTQASRLNALSTVSAHRSRNRAFLGLGEVIPYPGVSLLGTPLLSLGNRNVFKDSGDSHLVLYVFVGVVLLLKFTTSWQRRDPAVFLKEGVSFPGDQILGGFLILGDSFLGEPHCRKSEGRSLTPTDAVGLDGSA